MFRVNLGKLRTWVANCYKCLYFFYKKQSNVKLNMLNVILDGNDTKEKLEN